MAASNRSGDATVASCSISRSMASSLRFRSPVVHRAGAPEPGTPVPLFAARSAACKISLCTQYIVSADGQRFLLDTVVEEAASPIVVILNWKPRAG